MSKIHFIGDIFCDIVVKMSHLPKQEWGIDTLCDSMISLPGGSCLNAIIHAKNYLDYRNSCNLLDLSIFSAINGQITDSMGRQCLEKLHHMNIPTDSIIRDSRYETGSCIVLSNNTDRSFISNRGIIDKLSVTWFDIDTLLACDHLHISGFYNCSTMKTEILQLFQIARKKNISTSLNPQYDALQQWDLIQSIAPYLSFLIANETEIMAITKTETLQLAAMKLLEWQCEVVVVTRGSHGVIAFTSSHKEGIECSSFHVEEKKLLDTTGCGDAFVGGFLCEYILYKDLTRALRTGCLCGSSATLHIGGSEISIKTLKTVESSYL